MFSQRALAYLRTLERRDHIRDMDVVRNALRRHGVPESDALLEFHQALAGYVEPAGRDEFTYGIIHGDSYWYGALTPDAYEEQGVWYVTYADAHPSYQRQMDENGLMYQEGGGKRARSFRSFIEQHAFVSEFLRSGPVKGHDVWVPANAALELRVRLEAHRILDLCDGIADVWATSGWCMLAAENHTWLLWSRPGVGLGDVGEFVR